MAAQRSAIPAGAQDGALREARHDPAGEGVGVPGLDEAGSRAARLGSARRRRLRHVARPRPEAALQPQPLPLQLPLVLGLRRRADDGLGRSRDRHRALGHGCEGAEVGDGRGGQGRLRRRRLRDPRHAPGCVRVRRLQHAVGARHRDRRGQLRPHRGHRLHRQQRHTGREPRRLGATSRDHGGRGTTPLPDGSASAPAHRRHRGAGPSHAELRRSDPEEGRFHADVRDRERQRRRRQCAHGEHRLQGRPEGVLGPGHGVVQGRRRGECARSCRATTTAGPCPRRSAAPSRPVAAG